MNAIAMLPQLAITLDGAPLDRDAALAITEVRVQERLGLPTLCEMSLAESLLVKDPTTGWHLGAELRIELTEERDMLFFGDVTAIGYGYEPNGERMVRLRAYDPLHRLRKRGSARAYVDVTAEALSAELVRDLGLAVTTDVPGPRWPFLIQHRQSDFDLLADVCRRAALFPAVVDDGVLRLVSLQGYGDPVELVLGETLLEAEIELNTDAVCASVESLGWNALTSEAYRGAATTPNGDASLNTRVSTEMVGGAGERWLLDETALDESHATAMAQGELDLRTAAGALISGVAAGTPGLHAGMPVVVSGIDPHRAGRFVTTSVTHQVRPYTGFTTTFSSDPPPPLPRAAGVTAAPGMVSRVDDPLGLGRVKVTLPSYGEVETDWMGVLAPGGGAGKGIVVLPEVQDRVLVLFAHQDPAQGIVLGGLYGTGGAPEGGGVVDGAVRSYALLTAGGHRLQFDDAGETVRLQAANGSRVELGPERARIFSTTDLILEAPGMAIVIRGKTVDFQHAPETEEAG
jgi:phage baseplate assembly protein gpV/phage protein D